MFVWETYRICTKFTKSNINRGLKLMWKAYNRKIKDFEESLGHTETITEINERINKLDNSNDIVPFFIRD